MRPKQLVSVYLNEKEPTAPAVTPTPPLILREGSTIAVPACADLRFPAQQFDVQGFGPIGIVNDYSSRTQATDQQLITLASPEVGTAGSTAVSLTARVLAGFYTDKFAKGVYQLGVQGSITGTNGVGNLTFTLNIVNFFPEFATAPGFTVLQAFPGYQGWSIDGGYTNPVIPCAETTGVFRVASVTFLSATQVRFTFFNTGTAQNFSWHFTWIQ